MQLPVMAKPTAHLSTMCQDKALETRAVRKENTSSAAYACCCKVCQKYSREIGLTIGLLPKIKSLKNICPIHLWQLTLGVRELVIARLVMRGSMWENACPHLAPAWNSIH